MKDRQNNKLVMVAGHVCLDITPVFQTDAANSLRDVFAPGKLIHVGNAVIHTGGAVSNTGLAMKKLGLGVKLVAKIGDDALGHVVLEKLNEYGSGDDLVVDAAASTSYSIVAAIPGIDRIFLHHPGANDHFAARDITEKMLEGICHFHFGYPPLMQSMYENNGVELISLFSKVKARGITTSLDMAMVDLNSPAGKTDWHALLRGLMPYVDFFMPSVEELGFMLDRGMYDAWNRQAEGGDITRILNIPADVEPLADALGAMGAKVVLIKCGAPGMLYKTAGENAMREILQVHSLSPAEWCDKAGFEESYRAGEIVSGTGAGDTSIAAFIASMMRGYGADKCVKLAAATGACCVTAYDALSGLKPLDELWTRICQGWEKNRLPQAGQSGKRMRAGADPCVV